MVLNKDTLKSIITGMDKHIFDNMLQVYKDDSKKSLEELHEALENEEWEDARKCAHRFAGAAAVIGLRLLFETAKEIEEAIIDNRFEDAIFTHQVLKPRFEQSLKVMAEFLKEFP